ncbi:hypothetical protein GCM10008018_33300 [Paenibacillus marchantiophytorum]|uniref:Copper oxidase n=1 Tax=Paenibacillus marchantiophytorum TaxID=1619310 RepID=A0ABQ1ESW0_9BACL|nr:multicopper oxidase family protein [Paenibacillus marchantiophytorum]GFZ84680.1 hypothetical protein GCM10008018_33300 [Paenibacillus marchantiophytorum]
MYSISITIILFVSPLFFILAWIGSVKASRLLYSSSIERLNRKTRKLLFWSWFPVLPAALIIGTIAWMQRTMEQVFWLDRVFIQAPLIIVPILAIWFAAVPKLIKLKRVTKQILAEQAANEHSPADQDEHNIALQPNSPVYQRAASPALILPFQMTALGALTALYFALVPPIPFQWLDITVPLAVFVLATAGLWARHHIRFKQIGKAPNYVVPAFWKRASAMLGVCVIIAGSAYYLFTTAINNSELPTEIDMASGTIDYGRQAIPVGMSSHGMEGLNGYSAKTISVTDLTGPREGTPDRRFTLTAQTKTVTLSSGKTIDAWTYNGQMPGPELRMKEGELVEITLVNEDIKQGITADWHGLDVSNAEDGVAGATQSAVMPGETHTYRLRAEQVGTFWYHSQQDSQEAVRMGLFGALIVEPKETPMQTVKDITVMTHQWKGAGMAIGSSDQLERMTIEPGTSVRMRLINTDDWDQQKYTLVGTHFEVAAIDGTELNKPDILTNTHIVAAAGGRYDLTFIMPEHPVYLSVGDNGRLGILMSPDGKGEVPAISRTLAFDPLHYGTPSATRVDANSRFNHDFTLILDYKLGFYNRNMNFLFTMNGHVFPKNPIPTFKEGDLVKSTIVNRGNVDHPMHLYGHHMLVLSRNGKPSTGSPWWTDTLGVQPGETYEVGFVADNPQFMK